MTEITAGATVLVMDDDASVRAVIAAMLKDAGYTVIEAGSAATALAVLRDKGQVDILLADYAMPGMNGVEAARWAVLLRPGLPVLFITGHADLYALRDVNEDRIIQKPFRAAALAAKVAGVLVETREP